MLLFPLKSHTGDLRWGHLPVLDCKDTKKYWKKKEIARKT